MPEDTVCTEDNDIVFVAAEILYKANGNKNEEKRIKRAMKKYEEELEAYYMRIDDEDYDFDLMDDDLPFS